MDRGSYLAQSVVDKNFVKSQAKIDNPFLEYGTAFENFFRLELSLMMMFLVLTGLATLQMIVFACYNDTEHSNLFE